MNVICIEKAVLLILHRKYLKIELFLIETGKTSRPRIAARKLIELIQNKTTR